MYWRQPETTTQRKPRTQRRTGHGDTETQSFFGPEKTDALCLSVSVAKLLCVLLIRDSGHLPRAERLEEAARRVEIELRILRLDAQEEPVAAGQREARHAEHRVIGHRQAVEREHAEDAGQR